MKRPKNITFETTYNQSKEFITVSVEDFEKINAYMDYCEYCFEKTEELNKKLVKSVYACFVEDIEGGFSLIDTCPPANTPDASAWQALQSYIDPTKVDFKVIEGFNKEQNIIYNQVLKSGHFVDWSELGNDNDFLKKLGV